MTDSYLFYFFPSLGMWIFLLVLAGVLAALVIWRGGLPGLIRILRSKFFWIGCTIFLVVFMLFAPKGNDDSEKSGDEFQSRVYATVEYVRNLGQIVLLRIYADDFITANAKDRRGTVIGYYIRQMRGYADICVDLEEATLELNEKEGVLTLTLPEPVVRNPSVATNYAPPGTRGFALPYVRMEGNVKWRNAFEESSRHAQIRLVQLANTEENMNRAKKLAETLFETMLKGFDCEIRFVWKSEGPQEALPGEKKLARTRRV